MPHREIEAGSFGEFDNVKLNAPEVDGTRVILLQRILAGGCQIHNDHLRAAAERNRERRAPVADRIVAGNIAIAASSQWVGIGKPPPTLSGAVTAFMVASDHDPWRGCE